MEGMDAGVLEAPEIDSPEIESPEVETESPELEAPETPEAETETPDSDNPYTTKFSREYRAYLNSLKATDPNSAKFIKQAKDDFGRVFAIQQMGGIDGIREKMTLLDSLAHGETKGLDAITAMQEAVRNAEEVDGYILSGDPKAFESMGPEFNEGLAKLAPAYLDRLSQSSPEAYQSAIMPHVVSTLSGSEALKQFNYLVDIFKGEYGQLDGETLYKKTIACLAKMGESFNSLEAKATQAKAPAAIDPQRSQFEQERTKFEQERQDHHWKTNIQSQTDPFANQKFEELFKPYQQRLKLGNAAKDDLRRAWIASATKAMNADPDYVRQIKLFRSQKSPDAAAVVNFVKNAISKHAKAALDSHIKARYENFLAGKPKAQPTVQAGGKPQPPAGPNVEVRTVKPPMHEIDHRRSHPLEMAQGIYWLTNGKKIQVRRAV